MRDYVIAQGWIRIDENSTWQVNYLKWGTIMGIPSKYWIIIAIYLFNLWCMTFLIIMVLSKLL